MPKCLDGMTLAYANRADEESPFLSLDELAGGQISYLLSWYLGIEGEVEGLEGLHLFEACPGHPGDQPLVGPALQLILNEHLQEFSVAQMFLLGLPQPEVQRIQHAPELQRLQLTL